MAFVLPDKAAASHFGGGEYVRCCLAFVDCEVAVSFRARRRVVLRGKRAVTWFESMKDGSWSSPTLVETLVVVVVVVGSSAAGLRTIVRVLPVRGDTICVRRTGASSMRSLPLVSSSSYQSGIVEVEVTLRTLLGPELCAGSGWDSLAKRAALSRDGGAVRRSERRGTG